MTSLAIISEFIIATRPSDDSKTKTPINHACPILTYTCLGYMLYVLYIVNEAALKKTYYVIV